MRTIIQRVNWAQVTVGERVMAKIGTGLMVLLGVHQEDTEGAADFLARKIVHLRIFEDEGGKMNRSVLEVGGSLLVVSNFTLYGDCRKGRRPGFESAAPYEMGARLYDYFCEKLAQEGVRVQQGVYGAHMHVALENNGPVTFIIDSE